jgi:hypothetical protein
MRGAYSAKLINNYLENDGRIPIILTSADYNYRKRTKIPIIAQGNKTLIH